MMLIVPYDSHEGGEERGIGEEEGQGHRGLVPVQGVGRNVAMHLLNMWFVGSVMENITRNV